MATIEKVILSGSTNGRPIKVVATASPGTTIHTASSDTGVIDEIYLWAINTNSASLTLSTQWGGTTDPDDFVEKAMPIDANSEPILIAPGIPLAAGLIVKVFASSANLITIVGFVNRIRQ